MQLEDRVTVVTGQARHHKLSLGEFRPGMRAAYVVDRDADEAHEVAANCGGIAAVADVER